MKKVIAVLLCCWSMVVFASDKVLYNENTTILYDNIKILYWIDGDTCKILHPETNENISVRLAGIDTYEKKRNNRAYKQVKQTGLPLETIIKLGKESKAYVKHLLPSDSYVKIEFVSRDGELKKDRYERLLGYMYYKDDLLNSKIVREGYAGLLTWHPDTHYLYILRSSLTFAKKYKKGHFKQYKNIYGEEIYGKQ